MTSFVTINNEEQILTRIASKINVYDTGSPVILRALFRIGLLLKERIIKEVEKPSGPRPKPLIGEAPPQTTVGRRLLRSIQFRSPQRIGINQTAITVGSFGVAYARLYEKGFSGTINIPEYVRAVGGDRQTVRRHSRRVSINPRPFIEPGLEATKGDIIRILRESRHLLGR